MRPLRTRPATNRLMVGGLAVAIGLTLAGGVTAAAIAKSLPAKACLTSHQVLRLASKTGRCPKGDTHTTIGASGPRGGTGKPGANGSSVLNGTGPPTTSTGTDGDYYVDTATETIYGPKTSAGWSDGISLIGHKGSTGDPGSAAKIVEADSGTNGTTAEQESSAQLPGSQLTLTATCLPSTFARVTISSAAASFFIDGTLHTNASEMDADTASGPEDLLPSGTTLYRQESTLSDSNHNNEWLFAGSTNGDYGQFDLVINYGDPINAPNPAYLVKGYIYSATRCQAIATIIPLTGS